MIELVLRSFRTWHYARTHDVIDWQISWPEFALPKPAHCALVSVAPATRRDDHHDDAHSCVQ